MAGNFVAGHLVPIGWTASGNSASAALNVKEHSLDISVLLHDVTGVKANGVRARIAGPTDIAGRLVCDLDLDEAPFTATVGVIAGYRGIATWGVSASASIQLPLICEKVHFAGSTDKELMWDADYKCNSLVGSVVYPAL
jgi:hypothetical protein